MFQSGKHEQALRPDAVSLESSVVLQLSQIKDFQPATQQICEFAHSKEYVQWLAAEVHQGTPKVVADPEVPEEVTYVTSSSYSDALKVTRCLQNRSLSHMRLRVRHNQLDKQPVLFT